MPYAGTMPHYQFFVLSDAMVVKEVGAIALGNDSVARGLGAEMIGHLVEHRPNGTAGAS